MRRCGNYRTYSGEQPVLPTSPPLAQVGLALAYVMKHEATHLLMVSAFLTVVSIVAMVNGRYLAGVTIFLVFALPLAVIGASLLLRGRREERESSKPYSKIARERRNGHRSR